MVDAERRLPAERMRAIVVNSGNANALTGPAGLDAVAAMLAAAADGARRRRRAGGERVDGRDRHEAAARTRSSRRCRGCVAQLGAEPEPRGRGDHDDRHDEASSRRARSSSAACRSRSPGMCKGSGMIAPQLATTIAVVVTDCAIDAELLDDALEAATRATFDQLTIDGDMSTNDSVFVLANGLRRESARSRARRAAYRRVRGRARPICSTSWRATIAADGEGATKRIETLVTGAPTDDDRARPREEHLRLAARQGGDVRRRSELGARAVDGRLARRLAELRPRSGERRGRSSRASRSTTARRCRSIARRSRRELREPEVVIDVELRAGDARGARVRLRPVVRLRQAQRRLHVAAGRGARRRRREGRRARQLQPGVQARAARRGARVHLAVPRQALRDQVRRRGDDARLAASARSATTCCCCTRSGSPRSSCTAAGRSSTRALEKAGAPRR